MEPYRIKIVAANWKMNLTLQEGEKLTAQLIEGLPKDLTCKVVLAPPFTHLTTIRELTKDTNIHVAAQNCHYENSGPFTGEISPAMIHSLGVEYVIIGHSERRHLFHETNQIVRLKLDAALANGLKPIFCCGESSEIRKTETQNIFVRLQLEESLFHLDRDAIQKVCIAYEPVWAIGTGVTASPEQAQEMHVYIREQIAEQYDKLTAEAIHILYGGSVKADNAAGLFKQDDVDGGLVGGSSLDGPGFLEIVKAAC